MQKMEKGLPFNDEIVPVQSEEAGAPRTVRVARKPEKKKTSRECIFAAFFVHSSSFMVASYGPPSNQGPRTGKKVNQ